MCGIFGYLGKQDALSVLFEGLKKLEYRGYDSAGIAGIKDSEILVWKTVGKLDALKKMLPQSSLTQAIGHTRWATHGAPTLQNAHPHLDEKNTVAIVHNGVIENYLELKQGLANVHFTSETDSETIAHLLAKNYKDDFLAAAVKTFASLIGSFALAVVHQRHPGMMIATAEKSPLIVGYCETTQENFIASDPHALEGRKIDLYFLENREIALLQINKAPLFFNHEGKQIIKKSFPFFFTPEVKLDDKYPTHMEREIFEQPWALQKTLAGRIDAEKSSVFFEEIKDPAIFDSITQVILIGCGTSFHAAYYVSYLIEELIHIPAKVEMASEFIYRSPVITPNTLVIALSQSGETADTLAAVHEAKKQGAFVMAISNVAVSSIARLADLTLLTKAGSEIAVASTKTFTSQILVLSLFTIFLGARRNLSKEKARSLLRDLAEVPTYAFQTLGHAHEIANLAKKYAPRNDFFFLGRIYLYPIALEAALKLREIAYVDATGYSAGEMKHGPIAFLDISVPVIVFCADPHIQNKVMSNLMECKARGAPIITFSWKIFKDDLERVCEDTLWLPQTAPVWAGIPFGIAAQLFAYYIARERGTDIDQPRNLAKSVTVE